MKKFFYPGVRVPFSKMLAIAFTGLSFFNSTVHSQTTYLSTFSNPTGEYSIDRPGCVVGVSPNISDAENVSTATLTDFARLDPSLVTVTLVCSGVYRITANLNTGGLPNVPASSGSPYYAGFKVRVGEALQANLLGGQNSMVVKTLLNGVEKQNAIPSVLDLNLLSNNIAGNISLVATEPFNQVAVEIGSGILSLRVASSAADFFYGFASTAQVPIILPVKLTSFAATAESKSVAVSWVTTSEINVAKYELQRSTSEGITFNTIATIAAKGNTTSESKYTFADGTALTGNYIYRLKIVDKDGGIEYSKLALVKIASALNWKIYPTLLSSGTDLNVSVATNSGKAQVQLTNMQGQSVRTTSTNTNSKLVINTTGLSAGVYVLKLYKDGTLQTSEKVVIQ